MQSSYTNTPPVSPVMRDDAQSSGKAASPEPSSLKAADKSRVRNAMTVDVEDYYQVEAFSHQVSRSDWPNHEGRVERNVERLLQLLVDHDARGTFFTLGWVAERYPGLVALLDRVKQRPSVASNLAICRKILKTPVDLGL